MGRARAKKRFQPIIIGAGAILLGVALFFCLRALCYPRPYAQETGKTEPYLAYSVMKAESGFDEEALSPAGAVGIMQLLPSTAEFVCRMNGIPFEHERLTEGAYNVKLGCLYLNYLLARFKTVETALAAYNAGEGTVAGWLGSEEFSQDGTTLSEIPYPETARYVKKVLKFRKIYRFLYH